MRRKIIFFLPVLILIAVLVTLPAQASEQPAIQSANYCPACHIVGNAGLQDPAAWSGGIEHNQINPCPAAVQIREELYYTERLMLAIDRARDQAPASADLKKSDSRFSAASQNYSRMLDAPVTSLEAFTAEAQMVRYQMGKTYSATSQAVEAAKRAWIIWFALAVSVVIIASLIWGWVNARNALRIPHSTPKRSFGYYFSRAVFLLIIFGLFTLPIFRLPTQAVETPSAEEQERQAILDETGRAALTADRELSRAAILAQIGAVWHQADTDQGEAVFEEALTAAQEALHNAAVFWGLNQSAREGSGLETNNQAKAALVASQLDAVRGRTWALRLIADTWADIDAEKAESILLSAQSQAGDATYHYTQLDLRALAVARARFDPETGAAVASRIIDPALRSWAYRDIAIISGDTQYYDAAAEAARQVKVPVEKARTLRELGAASGETAFFKEVADALESVEGFELAYALADLAAASGDESLAAKIADGVPSAQALAYYGLGDYEKAWEAANRITDPFEQARAQAAIAGAWGNADAAEQITNPLLRDRALRDVSLKTGNPALAADIQDSYYQVQVLTAAGQYEEAWKSAADMGEPYPLVALGMLWAENNPDAAIQVVDALDREADKAEVLRAIAAATGEQDDFERALDMALAARVRGDALSPVLASIRLAGTFTESPERFESAISQAYEAALKINIIY